MKRLVLVAALLATCFLSSCKGYSSEPLPVKHYRRDGTLWKSVLRYSNDSKVVEETVVYRNDGKTVWMESTSNEERRWQEHRVYDTSGRLILIRTFDYNMGEMNVANYLQTGNGDKLSFRQHYKAVANGYVLVWVEQFNPQLSCKQQWQEDESAPGGWVLVEREHSHPWQILYLDSHGKYVRQIYVYYTEPHMKGFSIEQIKYLRPDGSVEKINYLDGSAVKTEVPDDSQRLVEPIDRALLQWQVSDEEDPSRPY